MSDEQEKRNEEIYQQQYLETEHNDSFLKEGDISPCPWCLDDVTKDQNHQIMISYGINSDSTSGSTHMEIYHKNCWDQRQKAIHDIEKKMRHENR